MTTSMLVEVTKNDGLEHSLQLLWPTCRVSRTGIDGYVERLTVTWWDPEARPRAGVFWDLLDHMVLGDWVLETLDWARDAAPHPTLFVRGAVFIRPL